mmetsp:Transcript_3470/g.5314  ORF Transcript_3470/g.5314 Transcript_3470/m.5314 type:complete len:471 (+) Transcript_3470:92-1504(+)
MGKTKKAEKALMDAFKALSSSSVALSKIELVKRTAASETSIREKHINKALEKLQKRGVVKKVKEDQFILSDSSRNTDENDSAPDDRKTMTVVPTPKHASSNNSDNEREAQDQVSQVLLPFAEFQRRKRASRQEQQKESISSSLSSPEKQYDNDGDAALPFAEILRRRSKQEHVSEVALPVVSSLKNTDLHTATTTAADDTSVDTDEEIRRLEAELADDSDDDESDGDDDSTSEEQQEELEGTSQKRKKTISFGETTTVEIPSTTRRAKRGGDPEEPEVLCLSTVADDRIAPLPSSYLPTSTKRKLKGIDGDGSHGNKKSKKAKAAEAMKHSGLQAAVKEVLDGYVARSAERLPFYCRVCAIQLSDETEFQHHKQTEFHKTAVAMERKASYCKLCRKQFTSPVQLKEHVTSKPHRERLRTLQSRQNHGSVHNRQQRPTPYNRHHHAQPPPFRRGGGDRGRASFGQRSSSAR